MDQNFIIFLLTGTITGITYSITTPFYPNLAYNKGFDEGYVGFIFALYSFGNLIFIPFTNKFIIFFFCHLYCEDQL